MPLRALVLPLIALVVPAALLSRCPLPEPPGHALFASPQFRPIVLSERGDRLYVANTTSNSISVIRTVSRRLEAEIPVCLEPVSLALRPGDRELWVACHLSDAVAVIDTDRRSPSYLRVTATVQDFDERWATRFDEPVGIAFADANKAYVALSSRNEIAVVDLEEGDWRVRPERIRITAQEPRAIQVRDGRLYVAAFESGNQTELSVCPEADGSEQCSAAFFELAGASSPNDPDLVRHVVVDPDVPDRDVFVFDTRDESPVDVISGVGTLLYGLSVDGAGRVWVPHTEARNAVNGLAGQPLAALDNRAYLNRIARLDCSGERCRFDPVRDLIELEPSPPARPAEGWQLATPYAVALSTDGSTLLGIAAASSRLFSLDAETGALLDVIDVGAIPRGLALRSRRRSGAPHTAYVLDTLDNTVTVVDVRNPEALRRRATIPVGQDPTPEEIRLGRIAFNDAGASSSGTFACASCHPDGEGDKLLWRIGGACTEELDPACGDLEPRVSQAIRGLRHSVPLHWDGSLGDPFGGPNGSVGRDADGGIDCQLGDADRDFDCFLDLVRESLGGVMCDPAGPCPRGGRELDEASRGHMARFLASVWHPPARSRAVDDRLSPSARDGFSDFFVDQGGIGPGTCADPGGCHELPLMGGTNGRGAFDAPSLRGLTDRWVHFSIGTPSAEEMLRYTNDPDPFPPSEFPWDPAQGFDERVTFAAGFLIFRPVLNVGPRDIFQMLEEASTGTSGATGRQVTLDERSLGPAREAETLALLAALEAAHERGVVNLRGEQSRLGRRRAQWTAVAYLGGGRYLAGILERSRDELLEAAREGELLLSLTAHLPSSFGRGVHRQPLLALLSEGPGETGNPDLPLLPVDDPIELRGIDIRRGSQLLLDGAPAQASLECLDGDYVDGFCESQRVRIHWSALPGSEGLHLLQVQSPAGPLSNELPICVGAVARCR